ncbi:Thylakoid soluble phosphoprotein TSP [Senna tora]|uniref:Thylakoid soluble phosphoprotein TSP n=1 Tax=Senna tora TaxID=362788 RepID=A0A834WBA5_9FABA|nr:Thylakoid soluble phosphoprotein TSP [Senna tora]
MASVIFSFAPPTTRVFAATAAKGAGGGSKEEKGFLDWILGGLQKEDQLLETDPILNKVEGKVGSGGGGRGTTGGKKNTVAVPQKKKGGFEPPPPPALEFDLPKEEEDEDADESCGKCLPLPLLSVLVFAETKLRAVATLSARCFRKSNGENSVCRGEEEEESAYVVVVDNREGNIGETLKQSR